MGAPLEVLQFHWPLSHKRLQASYIAAASGIPPLNPLSLIRKQRPTRTAAMPPQDLRICVSDIPIQFSQVLITANCMLRCSRCGSAGKAWREILRGIMLKRV